MAWDITWPEGSRELLETEARRMFPNIPDAGRLAVEKVEMEIRLQPQPSQDLPQYFADEVLNLGRMQVHYNLDSASARAKVIKVIVS